MKILWLSHLVPYPPKGGVQQRSYNLIRELSRHHDVVVLPFNQRAHINDISALQAAQAHFREFCDFLPPHSIESDTRRWGKGRLALRSLAGAPYTVRWLASTAYAAAVTEAVRRIAPERVHFDTISLAQYLPMTGGIPAALNHHNIESDMLRRRAELERNSLAKLYFWQESLRLRAYERKHMSQFNAHLTCSTLDSQRLETIAGRYVPSVVIPNGVDLGYFSPNFDRSAHEPNSIVFAGRLSWYPNAMAMRFFVKEIWPILTHKQPNTKVTIIGKSPPSELIEAAQEDSRITVPGFVDDVRPYLERATVYFCPIFDGGGTKLKILDALSMSCAIVAHPIACEGIDVTNGKDVLFASSAEEFADQIIRVCNNETLRTTLSSNARQLAITKYSFDEIGTKLARYYESLEPQSPT